MSGIKEPGGWRRNEDKKLHHIISCISSSLTTFSCELVSARGEGGSYVKVRNCLSNTLDFSSSLFAVLKPEKLGLRVSIFTYNEEELESEYLGWEAGPLCQLLTDRLAVGNYTLCCGIAEDNLVKMDLKYFEIKETLFEKYGSRVVFRSRVCSRVFDRGAVVVKRESEAASLCPCCRRWVQAVMDRMLQEKQPDTDRMLQEKQPDTAPAPDLDQKRSVQGPQEDGEDLVCLDGEVEQELQKMVQLKDLEPEEMTFQQQPVNKPKGRTKHPCLNPGCGYIARSVTVLRDHMPRHTGEANFTCNMCGNKFKHKKELSLCVKRHLGKYDHVCKLCDKKFLSKKKLDLHTRVHTGEKPFSCHLCSYRCARRDNLNSHTRKHHGVGRGEAEKMVLVTSKTTELKNPVESERSNVVETSLSEGSSF